MKDFAKSIVCNVKVEVAKVENSAKVGNAEVFKDGDVWVVLYAEGTKSKEFNTEAEAKKFAAQIGNSKVGNADKYSGNYIIMSDDGNVWFRDEHEDVSIKSIDSWAQKRISEYQRSIDEIKKGVQEAKQAAKKFGLI